MRLENYRVRVEVGIVARFVLIERLVLGAGKGDYYHPCFALSVLYLVWVSYAQIMLSDLVKRLSRLKSQRNNSIKRVHSCIINTINFNAWLWIGIRITKSTGFPIRLL